MKTKITIGLLAFALLCSVIMNTRQWRTSEELAAAKSQLIALSEKAKAAEAVATEAGERMMNNANRHEMERVQWNQSRLALEAQVEAAEAWLKVEKARTAALAEIAAVDPQTLRPVARKVY